MYILKKKLKLHIKKAISTSCALSLLFCSFVNSVFAGKDKKSENCKPVLLNFRNKKRLASCIERLYDRYKSTGKLDRFYLFAKTIQSTQRDALPQTLWTYCTKCNCITEHNFHRCEENMRLFICRTCCDGFILHKDKFINSEENNYDFFDENWNKYTKENLKRIDNPYHDLLH